MKCTLPVEVNECPFYSKKNAECKNIKKCTFQEDDTQITGKYVRKERWYEKYYNR